uniref:Uncharacterized protein n=1 Tax=Bos indicus x Bos taurus TaxID=30522 RepID=A0A4W2IQF3_BOBOX
MEEFRTEEMQTAVSCYLKSRQYRGADGPPKQGLRLSQSVQDMATSNGLGSAKGSRQQVLDRQMESLTVRLPLSPLAPQMS